MKKIFLCLVLGIAGIFSFVLQTASADGDTDIYGCVNYSGQSYIGAVVLEDDGTAIGCNQPAMDDEDLIPNGIWADWMVNFHGAFGTEYVTRLGRACDDCWIGSDGNEGEVGIPLGFTINYFGQLYDNLFVNSNGSISFGKGSSSYDQPLSSILGTSPGVCAYCIDLENWNQIAQGIAGWDSIRTSDFFYRGRTTYGTGNRPAFAATWINIPTYSSENIDGLWNTFQIMFVDIDDETDDTDIIINYGSMRNESDQGYCIDDEEETCNAVAIGLGTYDTGLEATVYNSLVDDSGTQLDGLLTDQLRDEGEFALNTLHLNSDVPGRFIFQMRGGELPGTITDAGPGCTDSAAANYDADASEDDGSCYFFPTNFVGTGLIGGEIELSWESPIIDETEVEYYYITYEPDGEEEIRLSGDVTEYVLEGLVPGQEYEIRICAAYDIGEEYPVGACHIAIVVATIAHQGGGQSSSVGGGGGGGGGDGGGGGGGGGDGGNNNNDEDATPPSGNTQDSSEEGDSNSGQQPDQGTSDDETQSAYEFALEHNITTIGSLEEAMPYGSLYRRDAAKMIVEYVASIGGDEMVNDVCEFTDISHIESSLQEYIIMSCHLGLMGLRADGTPATTFRPDDTLTRAEFGAILSRMLWGNTYNSSDPDAADWYVAHLQALFDADIMHDISHPDEVELRAYAWIIFQRLYAMFLNQ